jgi:hypothetical protein
MGDAGSLTCARRAIHAASSQRWSSAAMTDAVAGGSSLANANGSALSAVPPDAPATRYL